VRPNHASPQSIAVGIVTVSDTRTPATDENGRYLKAAIEVAGHSVAAYHLIPDEPSRIDVVLEELRDSEARVWTFNGGTGIAPRDTTCDVLGRRCDRVLPGFGELFRALSYAEIGPAAMLSRSLAGTFAGKFLFAIPGSPAAVKLAWQKLIEPELRHIVSELNRNS
jgi:molybdopterin adenylyltransferase